MEKQVRAVQCSVAVPMVGLFLVPSCNRRRDSQPTVNAVPHQVQVDEAGRTAFIDLTGRVLEGGPYADAMAISEGLAGVRIGDKWGYINANGRVTIQPTFAMARSFSD